MEYTGTENNRLYWGDCMEFMKDKPDNHYDLAIVDPPYGILAETYSNGQNLNRKDGWHREESTSVRINKKRSGKGSGGGKLKNRLLNTSECFWDSEPPKKEYFDELLRVSKNRIIWGGNYFDLPPTRGIICWDKVQPWENFSQFELAWTSFDKVARLFKYSNTGGKNLERKIHPTQKPIALYTWLLQNYAKPGQTLLDTHSGSGSFRIAAHDLGFTLDSVELDADYCKLNEERFQKHIEQASLFTGEDIQKSTYAQGDLF